jgi:2'-5' RNA ligase superfamily
VCAVSERTASRATRLVVPVAELRARVPGAHITLLDPFLSVEDVDEGVIAELRDLFSDLVPFAYVLGEPARFPNGASYLPPQPVNVFRRITHSLRRAFPEVIGPATSLDTVIPHLLLQEDSEVPTPLEVHAREALLLAGTGEDERVLATFRFGTTAA